MRDKIKTSTGTQWVAILITSVDTVLRGSLYGNKTIPFHMNKLASIDIDDIEDFEIAEVLKINIEKK